MNLAPSDIFVLCITLILIIGYGIWKSNASKNLQGYFLGDQSIPWWIVLLSIMGTQASAVTFISAPGQAYTEGMQFIQYYFGLPLAMIVICIFFVPVFRKLKIFTAYEYLENRFDGKTRLFTAFLFLISRGLSTGISLVAPTIVLHSMLGWDFNLTTWLMGGLLLIYTITGGAKAVAYTQKLQFLVIYGAMFLAAYYAFKALPDHVGVNQALNISGVFDKMNIVSFGPEEGFWKDRYNIFSGLIAGFFLSLSYFGTDQSQVGRYLTAKSENESKLGLVLNGIFKIPLQFFILMLGILLFAVYQFKPAPAFFNEGLIQQGLQSEYKGELQSALNDFEDAENKRIAFLHAENLNQLDKTTYKSLEQTVQHRREGVKSILSKVQGTGVGNDTNYIFLHFVGSTLPSGVVGLIIAIIFLSAWGSIAAALNSLSSCTMVDFHQRFWNKNLSEKKAYQYSKWYTFFWGVFCIVVAQFLYNLGNSLIEAVNILGSLFYGTILGIFLIGFLVKYVKAQAVFWGAIITQVAILFIYKADIVSFLWLNVIAVVLIFILAVTIQYFRNAGKRAVTV
ncbi:sodium:solute symporter [Gynurincola endophyticus]|uniref:sodium:solute symporter n=1 Tax=Gynurincola endophyticus TaxID=2479004 RepID=UPI000F8C5C6E|nr:sodium:solute symporter [Gynurincola endophyticus]